MTVLIEMKCKKHRSYTAVRLPTARNGKPACLDCIQLYHTKRVLRSRWRWVRQEVVSAHFTNGLRTRIKAP